jgi:hypothetical protein
VREKKGGWVGRGREVKIRVEGERIEYIYERK